MIFCFFSAQYLPTLGGVERYTYNLAKQLLAKGHQAIVVTSALKGLPEKETTQEGIVVYRMPVIPLMKSRFPVLLKNKTFRALEQELQQQPIDFVVVNTRFYTHSYYGAKFSSKRNIPAIVIEHGTAHLIHKGLMGFLGNIYEHGMTHMVRLHCKEFYGVSKACCVWLQHFHIYTKQVLYNAIEVSEIEQLAQGCDAAFVEKITFSPQTTVLAFSGRFIPEKGILPLLAAFARLHVEHPETKLLLAGDGPLMEKASGMARESVIFLGELPHAQNLALLKRADIFCLPTFSEGFCTCVLEAAVLHATILTTPTGGSPELVLDDTYGLLFPDMQEDTIYQALHKALQDAAWRVTAQTKAYHRVCQCFSWDKVSDMLIEIGEKA